MGWLRAAVMGANDGIVSTASLVLGVAGAGAARGDVIVAGVAGLVAGARSMAAGEYVSVSSQADTEGADLARERQELATDDEHERSELASIYVSRGLEPALATQVADQLMAHDALGAHARDELGISDLQRARPVQAAFASAGTFAVGAAMPLLFAALTPVSALAPVVTATSLLFLAALGGLAARAGGARAMIGAVRVTFWGALAMAITYGVGRLLGPCRSSRRRLDGQRRHDCGRIRVCQPRGDERRVRFGHKGPRGSPGTEVGRDPLRDDARQQSL